MRAIFLSRLVTVIGAAGAIIACNDSTSPSSSAGASGGGGGHSGISLVPRTATIRAGEVITLQARLIDELGDSFGGSFSWKSSDDAVATVASSGSVFGRSQGVVTITASASGKAQTSTVRVLAKGTKQKPLL